jgi:hypothetical protein
MRYAIARSVIVPFAVAALTVAVLVGSAYAQVDSNANPSGGMGRRHQQKQADKTDTQKPKVDDKAYNAALKSLPDKPFDPWLGAR